MQYTTIVKNESIWCIETDGKDAYNSQKKMQYHIYNMIYYVLKKYPQTNCIFSKLTYINAKKSEVPFSMANRCVVSFPPSPRIFLEILYKIFYNISK